jgi:hypothetical protein
MPYVLPEHQIDGLSTDREILETTITEPQFEFDFRYGLVTHAYKNFSITADVDFSLQIRTDDGMWSETTAKSFDINLFPSYRNRPDISIVSSTQDTTSFTMSFEPVHLANDIREFNCVQHQDRTLPIFVTIGSHEKTLHTLAVNKYGMLSKNLDKEVRRCGIRSEQLIVDVGLRQLILDLEKQTSTLADILEPFYAHLKAAEEALKNFSGLPPDIIKHGIVKYL